MVRRLTYLTIAILVMVAVDSSSQMYKQCAACKQTLFGEYLQVDGREYHFACFKCAECGKVIMDRYFTYYSDYFHQICYERRFETPCMACSQVITSGSYEDYWGGRYCAGHLETIPPCDFCGRLVAGPITGKGVRYPDGRILCGVCRPSAVTTEARAKALMSEVAAKMQSIGVTVDCEQVTVLLLGRDQLARLMNDPVHPMLGLTEYIPIPDDGGDIKTESFNIMLLFGMPVVQAEAVLVHELMHVWLFGRGIIDIDEALREGSCHYAAYAYMDSLGSAESNYIKRAMISNLDPVYGRGFRDVKQYVETNGVAAWLQMLHELASDGVLAIQSSK
jgi:hypothetical protein